MSEIHVDVVVVGSGFGGSVAALRLSEKGYRVLVLEAGRRYADADFPRTSWDLRNFLWAPHVGLKGIQRIHKLPDVLIMAGSGVGGGSLVYANTLYEPLQPFYDDPQWSSICDWRTELAPYYDQAKRMLGVTLNPTVTPSDQVMRRVADELGVGDTFHLTPVGVHFGEPGGTVPDPFFGGAGPTRTGCTQCGECMTGCRHGAKNTLTKNYLYLAERVGARVVAEQTVDQIRVLPNGGYAVRSHRSGAWWPRRHHTVVADHVVLAAGAYNTQRLLHLMRDEGHLPNVSPRLGALSRTNSESILGAVADTADVDYSEGVAITSSFHPDLQTHIEPVRYGHGSNAMGLLSTILVDGVPGSHRLRRSDWLRQVVAKPREALRTLDVRRWSQRSVIILAMQSLDNSVTVFTTRGLFGRRLSSRQGHGEPNPQWIPAANQVARRAADLIGGRAGGNIGDVLGAPMTAHFIGGAVIGASSDDGVIDPYHRVYGHPGLHVVDGAAVSANLGVNPSLTITAQAERAFAFWPNQDENDPRPALGERYRAVDAVAPKEPVVPAEAPGALRLPIVGTS
jgi:cholesterol oxidase